MNETPDSERFLDPHRRLELALFEQDPNLRRVLPAEMIEEINQALVESAVEDVYLPEPLIFALRESLPPELSEELAQARIVSERIPLELISRIRAAAEESLVIDLDNLVAATLEEERHLPPGLLERLMELVPPELLEPPGVSLLSGTGLLFPTIQVEKTLNKTSIEVGDPVRVTITVSGDTKQQSQPVATSVVLVLDESGSMKTNNNYQYSRAAALAIAKSIRSVDKIALVTFSTNATVNVPLTSDGKQVENALAGLGSPGGQTNLLDAYNKANDLLIKDKTAYNKMVILFTDGMPSTINQENEIYKKITIPQSNNIHYFTVGFGTNTPTVLLQVMAKETGGKFYTASQATDLEKHFKDAWASISNTLFVRNVKITEILSSDVKPIAQTLNYSISQGAEPEGFKKAMAAAAAAFYTSGTLKLPVIPLLEKNRNFTVHFDVTGAKCKEKATTVYVDDSKSAVDYTPGGGKNITKIIPNRSITIKACGVYVHKTFDEANRILKIEINNTFTDRSVNNVFVVEMTGEHVEALIGACLPGWPVAKPWYPPNPPDPWKVYGIQWVLPKPIPPSTKQVFSVVIRSRPSAKGKSPIYINPPHTTAVLSYIDYWYKDDQGQKVTVNTPMPICKVPKLEPDS